jgi:Kazal-type serine protease inhibitor domain
MNKLLSIVALLLVLSCQQTEENPTPDCAEKPNDGRVCTAQYEPVCGCNNITYGNACVAASVGITNFTKGECGQKK